MAATRPSGPFGALRYRDFRLLFSGMLISSLAMPMQWVAQMWLVIELADNEVANAVALNSMAMFGAMAIGPALSGFLIEWIGLAGTYFVIASTYLGVMLAVTLMRTVSHASTAVRRSMVAEVREGLAYVRGEPVVLWLISATFAITMLGMSFTNLAPVLIKDVLGSNAKGLGLTFAAWGVGAVAASLVLALGLKRMRGRGALLIGMSAVFALGLVGFAYSRNLWMASLFQLVPGASNTVFMVIGNAAILSVTPPAVRGRVMGIYMMNRGLMPVGALAAGVLGGLLGVQAAIAILGVATFAAVVAVTLLQPGAWRRVDAAIAAGTGATLEPTASPRIDEPARMHESPARA
ncbi:MAG: MFS transporter [Chloroflexi bacterium]|nr:MFS transporter [Chloroflexota bacterium]